MGGDLASGKSTFSRFIGEKYGVPVINKDRLKEILGDRFKADNREENLNLSRAAFDIICYYIESGPQILIVESNFKKAEMQVLGRIAGKCRYDVLSLVFKGRDDVLHRRFLERLNGDRHYVHRSQDFTNLKDFSAMLEDLRSVNYIGRTINVDSSSFSYFDDEALLREIESFLNHS